MRSRLRAWGASIAFVMIACDGGTMVEDAGGPPDATSPLDSATPREDAAADEDGGARDGGPPATTTTLRGRVFAMGGSTVLAGARVETSAGSAMTDAEGAFTIDVAADGGRTTVRARAAGYAEAVVEVRAVAGTEAWAELFLVPVTATVVFDVAVGASVEGGGARVSVPPGALVNGAGAAVTGMVTLEIGVLDPGTLSGLDAFPGTFEATRDDASEVLLESVSVIDIVATQGTERLQVAPGMTLEVEWPANDAGEASATIPVWSLDPETGAWREEGEAVRVSTTTGTIYRAAIAHMSWWNLDYARTDITCVRGCVTSFGSPVRNAFLRVRALSSGTGGGGFTHEDGCFAEDVRGGLQYSLRAAAIAGVSETAFFTAPTTPMRAGADPSACFDLGTIELMPRPASSACADGAVLCGASCVDLAASPQHCGACDANCAGSGEGGGGIRGSACVEGVCTCTSGQTACSSGCADTSTSRDHCGACGVVCPTGQACDAGACSPIVCAAGLTLCGNDCVDLDSSPSHCGACGAYCPFEGAVCDEGTCECTPGTATCGGGWCRDLSADISHCGACGNACTATQECTSGVCTEIVCSPSETLCGRDCADLDTHRSHCGACFTPCGGEDGAVCSGGSCVCPAGMDTCGGWRCEELATSETNCGGCGNTCTSTQECTSGVCTEIACGAGETVCSRACVDTDTDTSHCGGCGMYCPLACSGGSCVCPSGQTACSNGESFYCVTDGTTECPAGDVSGPCADFTGSYALTGTCPTTSASVTQRDCAARVTGACYAAAAIDGNTMTFSCSGTPCVATLAGDTLTVSCGGGACTSSGTRVAP